LIHIEGLIAVIGPKTKASFAGGGLEGQEFGLAEDAILPRIDQGKAGLPQSVPPVERSRSMGRPNADGRPVPAVAAVGPSTRTEVPIRASSQARACSR
jgi:hypothetical protein